jgi:hypothetical protein
MALYANPEDNMIYGRRGDSGIFEFVFDRDISGLTVCLTVKRSPWAKDSAAYVHVTYLGGSDSTYPKNKAYFVITQDMTKNIPLTDEEAEEAGELPFAEDLPYGVYGKIPTAKLPYRDFIWGLKVYDKDDPTVSETVIPYQLNPFPVFRLFGDINVTNCSNA